MNECRPKVADPPLPARSTELATPTATTTPLYRPVPRAEATTYRPETFRTDRGGFRAETVPRPASTGRPRPVAGPPTLDIYRSQSEAERDRWQQQQQLSVTPTRFPARPAPTDWPPNNNPLHGTFNSNNNALSNPFGNNNAHTNPLNSAISPPKEDLSNGGGGGGWFFSSDRPQSTERPVIPWFINSNRPRPTEAAPSGRWLFPDVFAVASTTESSWLFGADPGRAVDGEWTLSRLRGRSAGPAWGRQSRRLQDNSDWPDSSAGRQQGRTGRVLWPGQERHGRQERQELARREPGVEVPRRERQAAPSGGDGGAAVRWPDGSESTRWRVRPAMPTLPPAVLQRRSAEDASGGEGGGLLSSVAGLWCRLVGSCD